jgi:phage-related protein
LVIRPKKIAARFYETVGGRRPVRDWLINLSRDDRRIIGTDIQKVEFGWPLGMPYCRPLSSGLWEVRSNLSGGRTARVVFCIVRGELVLLHAFMKKTRKTPQTEIDLAQKRKKEIE